MSYFLRCKYDERTVDGRQLYTFSGFCERTGELVSIEVYGPDLFRYHQGTPIQEAFPYIDAWSREWMIIGRTGYNMDPEDEPDWDVPVSRSYTTWLANQEEE